MIDPINWPLTVARLIKIKNIKGKTILNLLPYAQQDVSAIIGPALEAELAEEQDSLWQLAVTHFLAKRLIINTRTLRGNTAFDSSAGQPAQWGEGSVSPASITDLLTMADRFEREGNKICLSILANANDSEPSGWYVL